LRSHGLARLAPNEIDDGADALVTTLPVPGGARVVRIVAAGPAALGFAAEGRKPDAATSAALVAGVRAMFALDDDLSRFYAQIEHDADLAFARAGVGRLLRSPSAFEEVVRTICTTNCAWSATTRMLEALVLNLGVPAAGASAGDWRRRAFPTPQAMAGAGEAFYRDVMRAGYRGPYFRALAARVAAGELDLEALRAAPRSALPDDELEERLLALPGVGPYAAAHIMLLFGRRSRLVLDSWTRPEYACIIGKKKVSDAAITRRFKRYGNEAGLAFWLYIWARRD
jgi:N-glycosylase/DNA lyase